jgi:acyl carrier protein
MNFIDLFNAVVSVAKPMNVDFVPVKSMKDKMTNIGIDSMDSLIIGIYFCELYGVSENIGKHWNPTSVQELYDLLMQHKTKEPESVETAIASIK